MNERILQTAWAAELAWQPSVTNSLRFAESWGLRTQRLWPDAGSWLPTVVLLFFLEADLLVQDYDIRHGNPFHYRDMGMSRKAQEGDHALTNLVSFFDFHLNDRIFIRQIICAEHQEGVHIGGSCILLHDILPGGDRLFSHQFHLLGEIACRNRTRD
jgi:hypothetical protein